MNYINNVPVSSLSNAIHSQSQMKLGLLGDNSEKGLMLSDIAHLSFPPPHVKAVSKPKDGKNERSSMLKPPEPIFVDDGVNEKYGIRCVCHGSSSEGVLIECDSCGFWLHGICVCVARSKSENYYCPYCRGQVIRCKCRKNMKYNIPLILCTKCGFWVHKYCENIGFGKPPDNFVCSKCGGKIFDVPDINLENPKIKEYKITIDFDRDLILSRIPDGDFKNFLMEDLNKTELELKKMIGKYFRHFSEIFFIENHEFWKCFVDIFVSIFNVDKSLILQVLDEYAISFLYSKFEPVYSNKEAFFENSESITDYLLKANIPIYNKNDLTPVELYVNDDGCVCTPIDLEDGQFICDLPGFLLHTDEVNADDGIPLSCISIVNTELIMDMNQSSFKLAHLISRSFHFNVVAKLYKLNDDLRAGLFATYLKGPYCEEKGKNLKAICSNTKLYLPFDGGLPYITPKVEWKDKKAKRKYLKSVTPQAKKQTKKRTTNTIKKQQEYPISLSLCSAFCNDIIPPLPYTLLTEQEIEEEKFRKERIRTRSNRNKKFTND